MDLSLDAPMVYAVEKSGRKVEFILLSLVERNFSSEPRGSTRAMPDAVMP